MALASIALPYADEDVLRKLLQGKSRKTYGMLLLRTELTTTQADYLGCVRSTSEDERDIEGERV